MKKSIASLAMLVSASSALSMPLPRNPNAPEPQVKTICINSYVDSTDGSLTAATCDQSENNKVLQRKLLANGCAESQVAIKTYGNVAIEACMPAGMIQL